MLFQPDIRFRPKVKNIPSVIHCNFQMILTLDEVNATSKHLGPPYGENINDA